MSIVYVEGTVSPGALVCVIRIIDGVLGELDFANMKLVTIPRNSSQNFTISVPRGKYRVIAFDLESNHLPNMPVSMVALSQYKMKVNSTGEGTCSVCYCCAIVKIVIYFTVETTSPPPSEGISVSNLTNGDVSVTCSDSALNCLVLFQSAILDRVIVGFINYSEVSTIISLNDTFGDGYVVVYSWNSSQSIFEGELSLIMQLDLPTCKCLCRLLELTITYSASSSFLLQLLPLDLQHLIHKQTHLLLIWSPCQHQLSLVS